MPRTIDEKIVYDCKTKVTRSEVDYEGGHRISEEYAEKSPHVVAMVVVDDDNNVY